MDVIFELKDLYHTFRVPERRHDFVKRKVQDIKYILSILRETDLRKIKVTPEKVSKYYDDYTEDYQKFYGDIFQAFTSDDIHCLLDYYAKKTGMRKGMRILDAGCGVAGPACYFAQTKGVFVEGLTISQVQVTKSKEKIQENSLEGKVNVVKGDYHFLNEIYQENQFDCILFLESLFHSENPDKVLRSAFKVLKPGGVLYAKDFYAIAQSSNKRKRQAKIEIYNIKKIYNYTVYNRNEIANFAKEIGFAIQPITPLPFDFRRPYNAIKFQEEHNIKLHSGGTVMGVESLELFARKPIS
ncbi:MAG: cyclopropane fatty-acyl-phospholipid synthase-like methyltransferase [Arenicella sp.]|jgi:cyclopropane fatty-acyl-phospholipid synthase-like methyltransferase